MSPSAAYYAACGLFLRFYTDIAVAAAAAAVRPLLLLTTSTTRRAVDERTGVRESSVCVERATLLFLLTECIGVV